jgi:hypothetical protein
MTPNEIIRQRFPHEKTQGIADDLRTQLFSSC